MESVHVGYYSSGCYWFLWELILNYSKTKKLLLAPMTDTFRCISLVLFVSLPVHQCRAIHHCSCSVQAFFRRSVYSDIRKTREERKKKNGFRALRHSHYALFPISSIRSKVHRYNTRFSSRQNLYMLTPKERYNSGKHTIAYTATIQCFQLL